MSQGQLFTKTQYGPETTYGEEAVSYTELPRVQNIDMNSSNGFIYDRGMGEGINASNAYYGQFDAVGNASFSVVNFDFLKHWIGPKTGTGTAGDPHVLTEATEVKAVSTALQPFSIEKVNDTETTKSADYMTGCVGTDFELSGKLNGKLECNVNFVGQKSAFRTTGETYTPVEDPAFVMINGTWKWGATPTTISGVREFSIKMNNGLIVDTRSIESRFMNIPVYGQRVYNFSVGIIMASALSSTIITDFYGGGLTPEDGSTSTSPTADLEFKIELVNGSEYGTIWLDQCSIDRISKPVSLGGGLVIMTFEGTALYGKDNTPIKWWSA